MLLEDSHQVVIERRNLRCVFEALARRGFRIVGPTLRDGAIVYDELASEADLPVGWTDEQEAGQYRVKQRKDRACFGYVVGPHSWKRFLHPPALRLWSATQTNRELQIHEETRAHVRFAFLGVRSCELHAIAIQDRVFLQGSYKDSSYESHRNDLFIVAVNCTQAGGTCFCSSMNTGPESTSGFDLALTEVVEEDRHFFVAAAGTERGIEVLADIPHRAATQEEIAGAGLLVKKAAGQMGRRLDTANLKELLSRNSEHPRWTEVASRCLTCANCTMVCPTCFCTTVEDVTDLKGEHAERWRKWDSCFTMDFSYIHGGSVRASAMARYRQWMTHKLATWIDQFGASGCVGCGRCITWCPVGIDLTEEARAIRESDPASKEQLHEHT